MPASALIPCLGLQTDRSKVGQRGALRVADHVVIDAPGVASARPNFELTDDADSGDRPVAIFVHEGTRYFVTEDSWQLETALDIIANTTAEPPDWNVSINQFVTARRQLYLTTTKGIQKLASSGQPNHFKSGITPPGTGKLALSASGSHLANGSVIAYRWVFVWPVVDEGEDGYDIEVTSEPSPYHTIENDAGAARSVDVTIPIPVDVLGGALVKLYASAPSVAPAKPADELFEVATVALSSGHLAAGFVTINDTVRLTGLGAALYTNATREGIESANARPPRAHALALWRDCLWFGNTRTPQTMVIELLDLASIPAPPFPPEDLFYLSQTCATTDADATVTVADSTYMRVGYLVTGTGIPAGAKILSITDATHIELTANATATSGAVTLEFHSVWTINAVEYYADNTENVASKFFDVLNPWSLAYVVNRTDPELSPSAIESVIDEGGLNYHRIIFEHAQLEEENAFTLTTNAAAHDLSPGSYVRTIDGAYVTMQSKAETRPNRVYYAKPDEPEHVPRLNWLSVGEATVLRALPLPTALVVFTTDGIYAVRGSYPNFSVSVLAPGLRLVRAEAADVVEDVIYAFTDRGVMEVTENGVAANLSEGLIRDDLVPFIQAHASATQGTFLVGWREMGLLLLGVAEASADVAKTLYVFNLASRAWSRWTYPTDRAWTCAARDGSTLVYATGNEVYASLSAVRGYDRTFSITTWTATGTLIEITAANLGTWIPAAGDWISAVISGTTYWRRVLLSADAGGGDYDLSINEAFPAGAQGTRRGYEGAPGTVEWLSPAPAGALAREIHVQLDGSDWLNKGDAAMRMLVGARSDLSGLATVTATPTMRDVLSRPIRCGVPRAVARHAHLYPHVDVNERFRWRVMGISIVGENVSERVAQ